MASILVSIGAAIFDIVSKQVVLSSAGRESQLAFYAADSGVECALFWDRQGAFSSTSAQFWNDGQPIAGSVPCGGATPNANNTFTGTPDSAGNPVLSATVSFSFNGDNAKPCATVTVTKTYNADATVDTTIDSRGHDTCVLSNPLRLERGIHVKY